MKIGFIITTCWERSLQLQWCLSNLRNAYPHVPVFVISDGLEQEGIRKVAKKYKAGFEVYHRLKHPITMGGLWWYRFACVALTMDCDWIIKIDPDTFIRRPLIFFPACGVFGNLLNRGKDDEHIQGGCMGINVAFLSKIMHVFIDPELQNPWQWCPEGWMENFKSIDEVSTDFLMMWALKNFSNDYTHSPEMATYFKFIPPEIIPYLYAASHPHQILPLVGDPKPTPENIIPPGMNSLVNENIQFTHTTPTPPNA